MRRSRGNLSFVDLKIIHSFLRRYVEFDGTTNIGLYYPLVLLMIFFSNFRIIFRFLYIFSVIQAVDEVDQNIVIKLGPNHKKWRCLNNAAA